MNANNNRPSSPIPQPTAIRVLERHSLLLGKLKKVRERGSGPNPSSARGHVVPCEGVRPQGRVRPCWELRVWDTLGVHGAYDGGAVFAVGRRGVEMREADRAYETLRADILSWELAPGTVLGEAVVSQQLGLSRTPIREALRRLEREKLVQIRSGRGAVVAEISLDSIAELFQMREAIETYAARLSARKGDPKVFVPLLAKLEALADTLDPDEPPADGYSAYSALVADFDAAIEHAANNTYLSDALINVTAHVARLRHLARSNPRRMYEAGSEHVAICKAILARDASTAANLTASHIHRSLQGILAVFIEEVTGSALVIPPGLVAAVD